MDMTFYAEPMGAVAEMQTVTVKAKKRFSPAAIVRAAQVVVFARPSIAGTSLSAVAPDYTLIGGTA